MGTPLPGWFFHRLPSMAKCPGKEYTPRTDPETNHSRLDLTICGVFAVEFPTVSSRPGGACRDILDSAALPTRPAR